MSGLPLTVTVVTLNEADNIGRCLESVGWAEELLVVDSGSDDGTRDIARDHGARILEHEWAGMVDQKQFATDRATHDWILNLDADEWVDEELARAVRDVLEADPPETTSYEVNRKSRYLGQWLEHGSWYPDRIVRLFNRNATHWGGYDPHAHVEPTQSVERLPGHVRHVPYDNLRDHLNFINDYTDTMADRKDEKGQTGSIFSAVSHSSFKFLRDLLLKRGILDGRAGIVSAFMGSWYVFLKYAKLWERQNVDRDYLGEI
jgi:glycosyltransferase involved in cell wall biosynthesis